TGIRRQRFHVATLTLGIDRVERERRLTGSGDPGEDDQLVPGQLQREVLEVVLTGAPDDDGIGGHGTSDCSPDPAEHLFAQPTSWWIGSRYPPVRRIRADVTLAAKTQTNVPTRTWSQAHDSAIYLAGSTGFDRIIPPPSSRSHHHVAWLAGRRDSLVRLGPRHVHGDEFRPGDPRPEGSC